MSKLHPNPIMQSDIEEYLKDYSDFSFELRVQKELQTLGLICQHGGTYDDPHTGKSREFDIRALYQNLHVRIHLSVECKNIQNNFPLVMHCLPRSYNESYNDLIHNFEPYPTLPYDGMLPKESSDTISETSGYSLYNRGDYVAKSSDQVGRRDDKDKTITATDGGVFEKISQAINSATDLILEAHNMEPESESLFTFICPVLVVPDSILWQITYSDDGTRIGNPEQVNHVSYYIGKEWTVGSNLSQLSYKLSHLEIITFSEITPFINNYLGNYKDYIESSYKRLREHNLIDYQSKH